MVDEIRVPASPLPRQLKEKKEAREAKEKGLPPVTPPATPPVAPATPAPVPATPTPEPIVAPATPEPIVPEQPEPLAQPATPAPAPAPVEMPKEGIFPMAPPQPKPIGPKAGEAPEDTVKRLTSALTTLQGKYNAEVPNLMRENARLTKEHSESKAEIDRFKSENERLTKENESLKKRPVTAPVQVGQATEEEKKLASKLGLDVEDLLAIKTLVLKDIPKPAEIPAPVPAPAPVIKPAELPVEQPRQEDGGLAPERRTYLETLDALIGGEEVRDAIVKDPKFGEFLELYDGVTHRPIRSLAREADGSLNAVKMAEVYDSFLTWKNQVPAVAQPVAQPTSQLMPSPKGGGGDIKSNKKPIYTEQQYEDFKRAVVRGDYRTIGKNPEEAKKIMADRDYWSEEFRTAKMEGRIVASQE
jgi:hypothetical protein